MLADYRRPFWRMAWQAIKRGQIEALFGVGFIALSCDRVFVRSRAWTAECLLLFRTLLFRTRAGNNRCVGLKRTSRK
jgi:hypothetical protein